MNSKPCKPETSLRSACGTSLVVMAAMLLAFGGTARAQFLCPTPTPVSGAAAGLDIPATTVTIEVTGESGPPGGVADVTVNMSGGDANVASVFFDLCFDGDTLDIMQTTMSTGAPCDEQADCPGDQECGNDGTCQADVVTACRLLGDLATAHTLIASSPQIPENPGEPEEFRRLRLAVVDGTRDADTQQCTTDDECTGENEICPFERCLATCTQDEDCETGNRCKDLNNGSEDKVCSLLNIIPTGDLVQCTFDINVEAPFNRTTSLDFTELLEAGDDSIPVAMALPVVGIPGSISIMPCEGNDDCPTPKICVDGRCVTPTPTPTVTATQPTAMPTVTVTGGTSTPGSPTVTPTNASPMPTRTNTSGPTVTRTDGVAGTPTNTRGATATATSDTGQGDIDDDSCAITPASSSSRTGFLLLVPAALLWLRRRRR